ncbi:MAG: glycosyltransferase [Candidatus Bathyarchaeia archaeon]
MQASQNRKLGNSLRVLQVNKLYYPWRGGIERVVQNLAEGLTEIYDCCVSVLCCTPFGPGGSQMLNGVKVIRCGSIGMVLGMPLSVTFVTKFRSIVHSQDVIHIHVPFPLADIACNLVKLNNAKLIVHYHGDIVRQRQLDWFYTPLLMRVMNRADRIIVGSPHMLDSRHIRPFYSKAIIIPYGIDLTKSSAPYLLRELRSRYGIREDEKVVLFVGRFAYYKGLKYLVDSMQYVNARLLLVGSGPLEKQIRRYVVAKGLSHKVCFTGALSDEEVSGCYALADVFVLPSIEPAEAFGLVQLEAMAHGLPVINTNLPTGVPWVSRHGETGFTVPPRDAKALAEAINTVLNDTALAARFSYNAKKRVQLFDLRDMINQIYRIYLEITANPK